MLDRGELPERMQGIKTRGSGPKPAILAVERQVSCRRSSDVEILATLQVSGSRIRTSPVSASGHNLQSQATVSAITMFGWKEDCKAETVLAFFYSIVIRLPLMDSVITSSRFSLMPTYLSGLARVPIAMIAPLILMMLAVGAPAQTHLKTELVLQAGHNGAVKSVVFWPNGKPVLSGSYDRTLKLWDVATGRLLRTFEGHEEIG